GAPVRAARERRQNRFRAARFLRRRGWHAREDAPAARRITGTGGVIRTDDRDARDRRDLPGLATGAGRRVRILKRLAHLLDQIGRRPQKSGGGGLPTASRLTTRAAPR